MPLVLKYELKATAYSKTALCCERSDNTGKVEMVNAFCAKVCTNIKQVNTVRHAVSTSDAKVQVESSCTQ